MSSLQVRYLLLRWCFCQKIIFLQRTVPPTLIDTYLEPGFTELKKLILNSILGRAEGIPALTFALAELHIQDSGLGLFNSADTSKAAFLASFVESAPELAASLSVEESEMDTELVVESSRCLEFFQAFDPEINQDNLVTKAAKAETPGGSSLQQHLSKILRDHQRTKVVSQFQDK